MTSKEIADVVERTSARATDELRQLWRRIVFSVLISNTDDHLRNHGFLHVHDDVWRLAPAFDLNPDPSPGPTFLRTAIDGSDDAASISAALKVAEFFRLDHDQARATLREVASVVSQWRTVAGQNQLTPAEITAMEPAFDALGTVNA
jgi:serine/threonine-protein kinase HipA